MIEQTKADVRQRLEGQLLEPIKIIFKKRPGAPLFFQFMGDPDSVERAKRILGIDSNYTTTHVRDRLTIGMFCRKVRGNGR